MKIYEKILDFMCKLEIMDTHEHLIPESDWLKSNHDVLDEWLQHYFSSDLVSAGLDPKIFYKILKNNEIKIKEKWKAIEPYWNFARNTGYGRALELAARDLYEVKEINSKTIEEINEKFIDRRNNSKKGRSYYTEILKKKSKIHSMILDDNFGKDKAFYKTALRLDRFVRVPGGRPEVEEISENFGIKVHSLDDWTHLCEVALEKGLQMGIVALKCGLAYHRSIYFPKTSYKSAEESFIELFNKDQGPHWDPVKHCISHDFQNYMVHYILKLADERGIPVQFHTGLHEGFGNFIQNSNPELLINVISEYKNVNFDLFHISYPYYGSACAIAKNFRNVTLDMCWAHVISPNASICALSEWLDAVPANKISGFGGDYLFVDGIYAHQIMARKNIAKALSEKIEDDVFDLDRAKEIATWLLIENPKRIFKL